MKRIKTKNLLPLTLTLLVGLAAASPVSAFKIDFTTSFVGVANIAHAGQPVHEEITRDAITNVMPAASLELIVNLQRGVQNADILHQFDSESHFDNSSVFLNVGFSNGFATMSQRIESARVNAVGNPEFLSPHYTSLLDIATDVASALAELAVDPECLVLPGCPTSQSAADAVAVSALLPAFLIYPNPDPHRATNPRSLFHYPPDGQGLGGYLSPIQEAYLGAIGIVDDSLTRALGDHFDLSCFCDRNLAEVLGSSNSHVVRLQRLQNAIRAYHAHQDLGHALHAAQDFFAHSDYVELMAGVAVGEAMPPGTAILLPVDFSRFNLTGLRTIMGDARFNLLESGEVLTIWLGDGDYSLGDAGVQNLFNPNTGLDIGGADVFGLHISSKSISSVGQNANPFAGFNHGHYLSSSALGLNKDCAFDPASSATNEPAHRNFPAARQAAVEMSTLLLTSFLQSIGELSVPIVLTCPPDKVVSTDPGQCSATGVDLGAPLASGGCQTPMVTNNASGQLLKGTNLVHWTATDSCGNNATCNQMVVVVDRELPTITCSTNRVIAATTSAGASVAFAARASDNCPGVTVVCIPSSGSTFPIGTNTVRCAATDASDNRAACSFTVRVKGAAEQIRDLKVLVSSFHLAFGMETSLTSQLQSALATLLAGNKSSASSALQSFIDHANAQSGKALTTSQAASLTAAARQIKTVIIGPAATSLLWKR